MPRLTRSVFLTTALTLGALLAMTVSASAQETGLFQSTVQVAGDGTVSVSPSFLTAGLASAVQGSRGQSHQGFGIGVKGGFLFSSAKSAQQDFGNKGGYALGIFFGGNRTGVLGVMGEILYAQRKLGPEGAADADLIKVNYIEIPI